MTVGELAKLLDAELLGDPAVEVRSVNTLDRAGPDEVTFLSNPRYRRLLKTTRAAAVIVGPEERVEGLCRLVTANPYLTFARALALFRPTLHPQRGVEAGAHVHPSARVGAGVTVMNGACVEEGAAVGAGSVLYPGAYVGREAQVGRDCVLHANAVVREGCVLGDRVILQPGSIVGSDGYGYARDGVRHVKIPQTGTVVLEDDVEIGACTTVDRAAIGETRIGQGTKIDNQVQIGHAVTVGEHCLVVAQVGVSGSARIGNRVVLAGQVGVAGHIHLGDGAVVGGGSGVTSDIPPGVTVSGTPAIAHRQSLKTQALVRRLPKLRLEILELEKRLRELESEAQASGRSRGAEEST